MGNSSCLCSHLVVVDTGVCHKPENKATDTTIGAIDFITVTICKQPGDAHYSPQPIVGKERYVITRVLPHKSHSQLVIAHTLKHPTPQ